MNVKKTSLFVISSMALLPSLALANGFYFTGKLGASSLDHTIERRASTPGLPVADSSGVTSSEETDAAFGLGVGYTFDISEQFYASIEGFYNAETAETTNINGVLVTDIDLDATYGARLIGGVNATDKLSVYAHAGATVLDYDINNSYTFAPPRKSRSETDVGFSYGVGADYKLTDKISTFVEYTQITDVDFNGIPEVAGGTGRINDNELDLSSISLGLKYYF